MQWFAAGAPGVRASKAADGLRPRIICAMFKRCACVRGAS